jgi:hypothetical protein
MVTDCAVLITEGAVYKPFDKLPTNTPPAEAVMDQVTDVFGLPVTAALNCWLCDAMRAAVRGLMPTLTMGGGASTMIVPELPTAGTESPAAVAATTPET